MLQRTTKTAGARSVANLAAFRLLMLSAAAISLGAGPFPEGPADPNVRLLIGNWQPGEKDASTTAAETPSPLHAPFGVAFTPEGRMVIVEFDGGRVLTYDETTENLRTIAGKGAIGYSGDGGPARDAVFNCMHNVAVARDGTIYIADSFNRVVRAINPNDGTIRTIAGTGQSGDGGDGGPATAATFQDIMCVSLDPPGRHLYLADIRNHRIRTVDLETGIVRTVAGNGEKGVPEDGSKATEAPLADPRAVAVDSDGHIYILERGGHALRVVDPDGTIRTVVGDGQPGYVDGPGRAARLNMPKHLTVDETGCVFIADDENAAIRRYDPRSGRVDTVLGRGHGLPTVELLHPHGVCARGRDLYVVDTRHDRIFRIEGVVKPE